MSIHKQFAKIWFAYYNAKTGLRYRMTPRDEKHLRNIRKALLFQFQRPPMDADLISLWSKFLMKIENKFILERLSLSMIDSMMNQLLQEYMKEKYPDFYSADFEKKLQGTELARYYQHLVKKGWHRIFNMGGYKWVKH
jgi:hypothetical protein